MAAFAEKEFFGGAIGGVIPQGWIDARYVYIRCCFACLLLPFLLLLLLVRFLTLS